jgi:hypothetical protein
MKRSLAALSIVAAVVVGACHTGPKHDPQWIANEISVPSENVLWAVAGQELQRMGFPVGSDANPASLVMTSGWKTLLAPFRGEGYRERAEVRFVQVAPDRYKLEARVAKEVNNDLVSPLDPAHAVWESAPDNVDSAQILLHRIRARLGDPLELKSPQPRKRGAAGG